MLQLLTAAGAKFSWFTLIFFLGLSPSLEPPWKFLSLDWIYLDCLLRFGILRRVLNTILRDALQNIGVSAVFQGDYAEYSILS